MPDDAALSRRGYWRATYGSGARKPMRSVRVATNTSRRNIMSPPMKLSMATMNSTAMTTDR